MTDDTKALKADAPEATADKSEKKAANTKGAIRETVSTVLWAVGIAIVLRTFLFQPFHIPSNSMQPGLQAGDYIITSKYSIGYGQFAAKPLPFPVKSGRLFERAPERGDVIVFRPDGVDQNYIKRLIGFPGEQLQMISGILYINGERVGIETAGMEMRQKANGDMDESEVQLETLPGGDVNRIYDDLKNSLYDNTSVYTVPAGHYFMMGDNRDHSLDSRVSAMGGGAGYVPIENLMGKAEFVLLSVKPEFSLLKPWTWLNMRGNRFFKGIK